MKLKKMDRRQFLKSSMLGTVGAGVALWNGPGRLADESPVITRTLAKGEKYNIGILGCGNRSKSHISALNNVPQLQVSALCDLIPHKMKRRAKLIQQGPEPEMYTDMEKMVRQDHLDAVAVVLPSYLHKQGTITALEAGKHVLCEKPMALTVAACNDMIATAGRTRKALQIGTQRRHSTPSKMLANMMQDPSVGKLLQSDINSYRGDWRVPKKDEYPPGVEYWRMDQRKCGGVAYEMGAHIIDLNNWIVDSEPIAVTSMQSVNDFSLRSRDSTDHAGILVWYANDALMNYGGNLYNYGPVGPNYFFTDNATVEFGSGQLSVHYGQPKGVSTQGELPESETKSLPGRDGTLEQWNYFGRVLAGEAEPFPDGRAARQTIQICQGAILASQERATVDVEVGKLKSSTFDELINQ